MASKIFFSHQKVYFWISAFDHRGIVVPKMHIVHCGALSVCLRHCLWVGCPCIMPAGQRVVESVNTERKEKIGTLTVIKCSFGICDLFQLTNQRGSLLYNNSKTE